MRGIEGVAGFEEGRQKNADLGGRGVGGGKFCRWKVILGEEKGKWDGENVRVLMQNANGKRGAMKGRTEKRGIVLMIR